MKIEVGEMPCRNEYCPSHSTNRPVVLFLNDETGGLTGRCDKCGEQVYGKVGDKNREDMIKNYCKGKEDIIRAAEIRKRGSSAPLPAPTHAKEEAGLF